MEVDFNNTRRQALRAYMELAGTLRRHCEDGRVVVDADELVGCMDELRGTLATIAATSEPGNEEFQCVLPDTSLPSFCEEN